MPHLFLKLWSPCLITEISYQGQWFWSQWPCLSQARGSWMNHQVFLPSLSLFEKWANSSTHICCYWDLLRGYKLQNLEHSTVHVWWLGYTIWDAPSSSSPPIPCLSLHLNTKAGRALADCCLGHFGWTSIWKWGCGHHCVRGAALPGNEHTWWLNLASVSSVLLPWTGRCGPLRSVSNFLAIWASLDKCPHAHSLSSATFVLVADYAHATWQYFLPRLSPSVLWQPNLISYSLEVL